MDPTSETRALENSLGNVQSQAVGAASDIEEQNEQFGQTQKSAFDYQSRIAAVNERARGLLKGAPSVNVKNMLPTMPNMPSMPTDLFGKLKNLVGGNKNPAEEEIPAPEATTSGDVMSSQPQ